MLENITQAKIKSMTLKELLALCEEIRETITATVLKNGGHLSSNLGIVELTVALHYVFDFPVDKVVFDVGHQCYPHKLLSGRYGDFYTLRQKGGISGFPKRSESPFDCYDTGHAGTAVSAALGIAKARDVKGEDFSVIAVCTNILKYSAKTLRINKKRKSTQTFLKGSVSPTTEFMTETTLKK